MFIVECQHRQGPGDLCRQWRFRDSRLDHSFLKELLFACLKCVLIWIETIKDIQSEPTDAWTSHLSTMHGVTVAHSQPSLDYGLERIPFLLSRWARPGKAEEPLLGMRSLCLLMLPLLPSSIPSLRGVPWGLLVCRQDSETCMGEPG